MIDAYHGHTLFYLVDSKDPVAATLGRAFPGLFRPLAEMPEGLRTRLRYPKGIFAVQAAVFATYHMTNPAVFYNKEDQWEVPAIDDSAGQPLAMQPYYTIMKLPGESSAEFIQMLPFTPRQKDNMAAWMVARSDGEHYGKLVVFQFPEAEGDLRAPPGRGPREPGPGDLTADHALEPAGLAGHPGHAAGRSRSRSRCSTSVRCTCARRAGGSPS